MGNIEKRIERLENREGEVISEKLITLFLELRGFNERYGLGPNPTREEVEAAIRRVASHSKWCKK